MGAAKANNPAPPDVRLDKWLWAARFFKTRNLASDAITGGHVQVNGDKGKPARTLKLGDRLRIKTPSAQFEVIVSGLSDHRGSAVQAQQLYEETAESVEARALRRAEHALAPVLDHPDAIGRPTKKLRRQLNRLHNSFD
jgi:ribosome-associated heat shock protein Hsp15